MKLFVQLLFIFLSLNGLAQQIVFEEIDRDESRFVARITDRDESGRIFKIRSENRNVKFFQKGDQINFNIYDQVNYRPCSAQVKDVEESHIVVKVSSLYTCWRRDKTLLRGTIIKIDAPILAQRVLEAKTRYTLLNKEKTDLLSQLNGVNNFIWNFDLEKSKVALEYDRRISELLKEKKQALIGVDQRRDNSFKLQRKLRDRLDKLDFELVEKRVEKQELFYDRWNLDHDLGRSHTKRPNRQKPL